MNLSPIIQSMDYLMEDKGAILRGGSVEQANAFQKILLEEVFVKSFVPDEQLRLVNEDDEENQGLSFQSQSMFQNQLMRRVLTGHLVDMDALSLREMVSKNRV